MAKNIFGKLKWLVGLSALNPYKEGITKALKIYAYMRILFVLLYLALIVFVVLAIVVIVYFLTK